MRLSTAQLGVSSQKWVYQDVSAVGMGRRPRRGEKAREGGGEARSTNSFIPCFLPSASASFILGFAGPLPPPPLCYQTEAMLTAGDPGLSLLGGLSALPPNPPSPLGFRPFRLLGAPHRTQPTQLGAPPGRQCSGDLALARPKGCSKIRNPG